MNKLDKLFKQKGFTLTEMTVVITIFVLIIITVYLVFAFNQGVYLAGEKIAEITQNGRVILGRMTREIRQAEEIVTDLTSASNEIIFQDGHSEFGTARGGSSNTIDLDSGASDILDYYKNMMIQIIEGTCSGQIREITAYDEVNQTAAVDENWAECIPDTDSEYKVFGSYHYIHYFQSNSFIKREVIGYYISGDSEESLVPWDAGGTLTLVEKIIETPKIIGEWVETIEFWGSEIINIALTLEKRDKTVDFQTKIFGRNL